MTERIRWERIDGTVTSWFGYVGSHKTPMFQILHPVATKPDSRTQFHKWALAATFAQDEVRYPETAEGAQSALKDEAEDWLAGFVASLGAVFGDAIAADLRSRADDLEAMVCREPGQERDNLLFAAGLKRAADLVEHGDIPGTTAATAEEKE